MVSRAVDSLVWRKALILVGKSALWTVVVLASEMGVWKVEWRAVNLDENSDALKV